jgi:hypothetical protein
MQQGAIASLRRLLNIGIVDGELRRNQINAQLTIENPCANVIGIPKSFSAMPHLTSWFYGFYFFWRVKRSG